MSEQNSFTDLVFKLSDKDFELLQDAVALRKNKERYGVTNFVEFSRLYNRIPTCPYCDSDTYVSFGYTAQGLPRYKCTQCGRKFNLLSNSIFHSTNKSIDTWISYLILMTFNVPLEMTEEICNISHSTAMLCVSESVCDCRWISETPLSEGSYMD